MINQPSEHHEPQQAHDQLEPEEHRSPDAINGIPGFPVTPWHLSHLVGPQRHQAVLQLQRDKGNAFVRRVIDYQRSLGNRIRRAEDTDIADPSAEEESTEQSLSTDTTGVVKWFNSEKGYGFISAEGQESDIYFSFSAIVGDIRINEGDRVMLTVVQGKAGLQAVNVRKI